MQSKVHTTDRWLTETEAAAELGLRGQTLAAWRCQGHGPKFTKMGRSVRYRASEIERYVASRTFASTAQAAGL